MEVNFQISGRRTQPVVNVYARERNHFRCFNVDLEAALERYVEQPNFMPYEIHTAVKGHGSPDWYDGTAFKFVKDTVEGQHLLEWVVSQYGIDHPLNLHVPTMYASEGPELGDKEKWEAVDAPSIDPTKRFLEEVDTACDTYIYTLRVVDHDTDEEMYYVGRSTKIMNRLDAHISSGGDFSAANRRNTEVHEILSIQPRSEITEEERYEQMLDSSSVPVHGGQ